MKDMTQTNLQGALAGESQAHIRYMLFAEMAERERLTNIARLFRAASFSEQVHASNHMKALGGVNKTAQNLEAAFGGENFEITEMYPAYIDVARLQDEKRALGSMSDALEAEQVHRALYGKAQEAVSAGQDGSAADIYVCPVCGMTMEGEAPDRCPVCGANHSKFQKF